MSREDNDSLEAAQVQVRAVNERLDEVEATIAGLTLQRERLEARLRALKRRRRSLRSALDARPGSGVLSIVGVCLGAVLARGGWELKAGLVPDERILFAVVALATSLALYVSRTHGFRFGLLR